MPTGIVMSIFLEHQRRKVGEQAVLLMGWGFAPRANIRRHSKRGSDAVEDGEDVHGKLPGEDKSIKDMSFLPALVLE